MKNILIFIVLFTTSVPLYAQDTLIQNPQDYPFGAPGSITRGVFGNDDRKEVKDAEGYEDFVRATAVMVPKKAIRENRVYGYDLKERLKFQFRTSKFHENVKFLDQPAVANCTGFLIAPDILVTAGHCITTMEEAEQYVWLFEYTSENDYDSYNRYFSVDPEDIFEISEVLGAQFDPNGDIDYAVLRLNRKSDRRPYRFRTSGTVENGTAVNTLGSPTGLPLKFSTNAKVTDNGPTFWFKSNIDSFPGNSGGPVFDQNGFVEGILVRGAAEYINGSYIGDYKYDEDCECIKTISWETVEMTAGCQAHKISTLPGEILIQAIYDNLYYAIENNLEERFEAWEDYDWIFDIAVERGLEPLEERAVILRNSIFLEKILRYRAEDLSDHEARRLLEGAAWRSDLPSLKVALEAGLYSDAGMDAEFTVLQMSVKQSDLDEVELLISYGANVQVEDKQGNSLLHLCAERGSTEIAKLLVAQGLDAGKRNKAGMLAEKIAKKAGYKDLEKYLKKVRKGKS